MSEEFLTAIFLSIKVGLVCVSVISIPGVFMGWLLARKNFPGKVLLDAIVHIPLVTPPVVIGYGLLVFLGRKGLIGAVLYKYFGIEFGFTWMGAVIASAVMGFPLLVRSTRLAIELVDQKLEKAARTLGLSPFAVFCKITLPLSLPGIMCGLVLSFARSLGEFGATATFAGNIEGQTQTISLAIFTMLQQPGMENDAMYLACVSIAISLGAIALSEILMRRAKR